MITKTQEKNRIEKHYNIALKKFGELMEYISVIETMPPRGDGAKDCCTQEVIDLTASLMESIKVVRQKLINLIYWEDKEC